MIDIILKRNNEGKLYSLKASGHSGYAKSGQDIICAAVSVLTVNTANSIEAFTEDKISSVMKDGFLEFELETVGEKSSLLMEAMLLGLKGVEEENGNYISVTVN